jgi:hypothetical protein
MAFHWYHICRRTIDCEKETTSFEAYRNSSSIRNSLLFLDSVLLSGGERRDLDDGGTVTVIAALRGNVGAGGALIPCTLFVWRDSPGASLVPEGRRSGVKTVDWD